MQDHHCRTKKRGTVAPVEPYKRNVSSLKKKQNLRSLKLPLETTFLKDHIPVLSIH